MGVTATNPQTGETVEFVNGKWAPQRAPANSQERQALTHMRNQRDNDASLPGLIDNLSHGRFRTGGRLFDDSDYRDAMGRRAQDAGNTLRQIPSLNLPQLVGDTMQAGQNTLSQFGADPLGNIGRAIWNLPGAVVNSTAGALMRSDEALQSADLARMRGDAPGVRSNMDTATREGNSGVFNTAGLFAAPFIRGVLPSAGFAAGMTLPQSIAPDAGLQDQLPQALVDTGTAAAIAAPLGLFGRRGRANSAAPPVNERLAAVQDAQQANMPVMAAALNNGAHSDVEAAAPMTMTIARDPIGGIATRMRLRGATTAARAQRNALAGHLGGVPTREAAGDMLQRGVADYNAPASQDSVAAFHTANPTLDSARAAPARDWGVRTKAAALYDHVLRPIERNAAATSNTMQFLTRVANSIDPAPDSLLAAVRAKLNGRTGTSIGDLRLLRERVDHAIDWGATTPDRDAGQLRQLRGALTQDIYAAAGAAAPALQKVDQYYARAMTRVRNAIGPLIRAKNPGGALQQMLVWGQSSARQNSNNLLAVKRALSDSDFQAVTSSILGHMGDDGAGHFSINRFAREYGRLDPRGRRILFGNEGGGARVANLLSDLDALGRTAQRFSVVRGADNFSGSATHLMGNLRLGELGGGAALAATHSPAFPIVALFTIAHTLSSAAVGELLTNPVFVRFLAGAPRGASVARMLPRLAVLAARDPSLVPAYRALAQAQQQGAQSPVPIGAGNDQPTLEPQLP